MNPQQYGLCLCCGAPFAPLVDDIIQFDKLGSISLLYFERDVRESELIQQRMNRGTIPHFCNRKQAAHMLHVSHHQQAVKFLITHHKINNDPITPQEKFPFFQAPSTARRPFLATWGPRPNQDRVNMSPLWQLLTTFDPPPNQPTLPLSLEYNLTVDTCQDCNMVMTMQFWYRYHLYTSTRLNPHRIISNSPITVYTANIHGHNNLDNANHWTVLRIIGINRTFPEPVYSKTHDYASAYIAYFLHLCLPANLPVLPAPPGIPHDNEIAKRGMFTRLCWIIMQITCLVCEYKRGAQDKGKFNVTSKSILGAIELYISQFAWFVSCYKDPALQGLTFIRWHQYYFCDLASWVFTETGFLLADKVIPTNFTDTSKNLVQHVCHHTTKLYNRYFNMLSNIICRRNTQTIPGYVKEHFLSTNEMRRLETICNRALPQSFDSLIQHIGIRALWSRVLYTCRDYPNKLQYKMNEFMIVWLNAEVTNIMNTHKITYEKAIDIYDFQCNNPLAPNRVRGVWASVMDLKRQGAFSSVKKKDN